MLTKEEFENRKKGIGASDVAAILGLSPYQSALDIYHSKTDGQYQPQTSLRMDAGTYLEPFVCGKYEETRPSIYLTIEPTCYHPTVPYFFANIDARISDGGVLEAKTASYPGGWGKGDDKTFPTIYKYQVAWQRFITDAPYVDLCVLISLNDLRVYRYVKDEAFERSIEVKMHEFWNQHVLLGCPPAHAPKPRIVETTDEKELTLEADVTLYKAIEGATEAKRQLDNAQALYDMYKGILTNALTNHTQITDEKGNVLVSYSAGAPRSAFDSKRFKKDHSDLYDSYTTVSEPVRVLRIKG